jgi:hypothetical protein
MQRPTVAIKLKAIDDTLVDTLHEAFEDLQLIYHVTFSALHHVVTL